MANNAKKEKGKEEVMEEVAEKFRQGLVFRAKLIGIDDVPEARGDKMCQDKMQKLKSFVKASGTHKQRILINISLDGLQIRDQINHTSVHTHAVHRISFIARDVTDHRAFGYIFGPGDGTHKFYAIKTEKAAETVVLALRDLFQVVYEMKKKEMEEKKEGEESTTDEKPAEGQENVYQVPQNGAPVEGTETVYQVPTNNAEVPGSSNLVDLEGQLETLQQGIEQMNTLEDAWATTPASNVPRNESKGSMDDLEGLGSGFGTQSAFPSQGFGNQPFGIPPTAMTVGVPFAPKSQAMFNLGGPASFSQPGFGMPAQAAPAVVIPGPNPSASPAQSSRPLPPQSAQPSEEKSSGKPSRQVGGLPIADDPFADDPFSPQPRPGQPFGQPGFAAPNPFGGTPGMIVGVGQPGAQPGFGGAPFRAPVPVGNPFPGPGVGRGQELFPQSGPAALEDPNILQPQRPQSAEQEPKEEPGKPKKNDPFGDLVDIGGTAVTRSPKQLFEDKTAVPKKSLNELKVDNTTEAIRSTSPKPVAAAGADPFGLPSPQPGPQASDPFAPADGQQGRDPFGPLDGVMAGFQDLSSSRKDPFDTSFVQVPKSLGLFPSAPPPLPPRVTPQPASSRDTANSSVTSSKLHAVPSPVSQNVLQGNAATKSDGQEVFHIPSPTGPPPPLPAAAPPPPPPRPRPQPSASTKSPSAMEISPPVPKPRKSVSNSVSNGVALPNAGSENLGTSDDKEDPFSALRDKAWESLSSPSSAKSSFASNSSAAFSDVKSSQGKSSPSSLCSKPSAASGRSDFKDSAWPGESTPSSSPWPVDFGTCSNGSAHEDLFSDFGKKGTSPFDDAFAPQNGEGAWK